MDERLTFERFFDQIIAWESLIALGVFSAFMVGAFILRFILKKVSGHLEQRAPDSFVPQMLNAARGPAVLFVFTLGIYLGIISLPIEGSGWRQGVTLAWTLGVVIVLVQAAASAVRFSINWYLRVVAPKTETPLDDKMLPQVRRILLIVVYGIGFLIALDALGVSISPMLGGLGITGLAVALALQPTLSNFFAGTYVMSDGAMSVGDYIELNGGPSGYVTAVGWRSTKIRTIYNNLVIIPNAVLADTIFTNYQTPNTAVSVLVNCGVSYDSDLVHVQAVALAAARKVVGDSSHAADFDPIVNFKTFGDSNIDFYIFARARDRIASFRLTSELIKEVHARFSDEGIEINYPVRKIVYEGGQKLPVELTTLPTPSPSPTPTPTPTPGA
jgi:small-conductance mechanosensitive channel